MTITEKTVTLYTFDDLPTEEAKEKARDWWREVSAWDTFEYEYITDDAKEIAKLFGYDIENIWWSGFAHQGQGAVCEGTYVYQKGALNAIVQYAPQDVELHNIVKRLQDVQRRHFYQLEATTHQGRGMWLNVNVTHYTPYGERYDVPEAAEDQLSDILRDFSAWVYSRLDSENDYINSDEYIDDALIANEYTFNNEGERQD